MYRQFPVDIADKSQESPPSATWLFAQQLLGNPVPIASTAAADTRARQEHLEWLASISPDVERQLRRAQQEQADAQAQRERLEWLATISERHEAELRRQLRIEAEAAAAQTQANWLPEDDAVSEWWDPIKHPRTGTPPNRGWFAQTNGPAGAATPPAATSTPPATPSVRKKRSDVFDAIIKRNLAVGELSGVVTPAMIRSSRLAAELQAATKLPAEVSAAAAKGLGTGGKAVVNGAATAVKSAATLGLNTSQLELIGVTKEDRERGYDTAVAISTASGQVLVAVGTGGIASALSKGGTVARSASGALIAYDAAGNAVGVVQGVQDVATNGLTVANGAKIAGGALGLSADAKAVQTLRQSAPLKKAAPHNPLPDVDEYVKTLRRIETPTKTAASQYEIKHTGPSNYEVSVDDVKVEIDGYRGTTILEAKHVGNPTKSPFVPRSSIEDWLREEILNKVRHQLDKMRIVIESRTTPFKSIEIITNSEQAKPLFEGILKELKVPGKVVVQP